MSISLNFLTGFSSLVRSATLLMLLFWASSGLSLEPSLEYLEQLKWKNRVILIWSDNPNNTDADRDSDIATLQAKKNEIDERHIYWFSISADDVDSNFSGKLSKKFVSNLVTYRTSSDKVVLIGKDGGRKYTSPKLDLKNIFSRIDAMPMRILEMEAMNTSD